MQSKHARQRQINMVAYTLRCATHPHTRTRTRTRTYAHAHAHPLAHAHAHAQAHAHAHAHHARARAHKYLKTYINTYIHTCIHYAPTYPRLYLFPLWMGGGVSTSFGICSRLLYVCGTASPSARAHTEFFSISRSLAFMFLV